MHPGPPVMCRVIAASLPAFDLSALIIFFMAGTREIYFFKEDLRVKNTCEVLRIQGGRSITMPDLIISIMQGHELQTIMMLEIDHNLKEFTFQNAGRDLLSDSIEEIVFIENFSRLDENKNSPGRDLFHPVFSI
jgi:hypothetical protein